MHGLWERLKKRKAPDLLLTVLLLYALSQQLRIAWGFYQREGARLPTISVALEHALPLTLPEAGKKLVVVVWATWCKPCELELARFRSAVADGKLAGDRVLALSMGEDPRLVFDEARKRNYSFRVAADPDSRISEAWDVQATPTIFHVNADGTLQYGGQGLGILTILRAQYFLNI